MVHKYMDKVWGYQIILDKYGYNMDTSVFQAVTNFIKKIVN